VEISEHCKVYLWYEIFSYLLVHKYILYVLWNTFLLSTFVESQPVRNGGILISSRILKLAGFTSQPQASCGCVSHTLTQYALMKKANFFQ